MIRIRRSDDRGLAEFGWLTSRHTFSFGHYHEPQFMGHGALRVVNEDRVAPGKGFGAHSHRDMEILSWVLEGALEHKDSLGTTSRIVPGELQRMSAGTGVTHSEFNASPREPVHFLQIWIIPAKEGIAPGYEQRRFDDLESGLRLVASGTPRDGALRIHQDAELYVARLAAGGTAAHRYREGRLGWLQVARGAASVGGERLAQGDGAAIEDEAELRIAAQGPAEILLFDLPP
ncbi:MAG TPA: pirin family protein [Candidatus Binatia bacterium]|nr:pirin family protein [Candidatus Binatia bacterium]